MDLRGKNAIVTGGAKRLGRAISLALADRGANVAIHYNKSMGEAADLVKKILGKGLKGIAIKADIKKTREIARAVRAAADYLGGLDILVNNAAIFYPTPLDEIDEGDWGRFLGINLTSQFYFSREFASLRGPRSKRGTKRIINISDSYAGSPATQFIPYGVSKAGVIALTKGLAKALAPHILVNCICPGPILMREGADRQSYLKAVSTTLLKREGSVEDITKTVVFLAENDYITGQAIFVDGGRFL